MEVVLLSQHPELLEETADLLNSEWKRSASARLQSLERSVLQLPDSLLLIEKNDGRRKIIGHSRLTRVLEDSYGCWIGSVVISKDKRKKGYGKYLMQKTEEYAKTFKFFTIYLNTRDQQGFYEHLGYSYCNPVSSISFHWNVPKNIASSKSGYITAEINSTVNQSSVLNAHHNHQPCPTESISVPPPPPLLTKNATVNNNLKSNLGQYWMKKKL